MLRATLKAFSTTFGVLGIFFLYMSFRLPALAAQAVVFLSAATAIFLSVPQR
jgi:hypothetical protein